MLSLQPGPQQLDGTGRGVVTSLGVRPLQPRWCEDRSWRKARPPPRPQPLIPLTAERRPQARGASHWALRSLRAGQPEAETGWPLGAGSAGGVPRASPHMLSSLRKCWLRAGVLTSTHCESLAEGLAGCVSPQAPLHPEIQASGGALCQSMHMLTDSLSVAMGTSSSSGCLQEGQGQGQGKEMALPTVHTAPRFALGPLLFLCAGEPPGPGMGPLLWRAPLLEVPALF